VVIILIKGMVTGIARLTHRFRLSAKNDKTANEPKDVNGESNVWQRQQNEREKQKKKKNQRVCIT
jgi:hypothetical protein